MHPTGIGPRFIMTRWSRMPFFSPPTFSCSNGKSICWLFQSQGDLFECVTSALIAIDIWNSSPLLAAQLLDSPLPSGNDTKCTPAFLSARLLWGGILNRLWQGDLCYRLWWWLPSLLRQKDILSVNKVERKVALNYLILWSSAYYRGTERWTVSLRKGQEKFLLVGRLPKVKRRLQAQAWGHNHEGGFWFGREKDHVPSSQDRGLSSPFN